MGFKCTDLDDILCMYYLPPLYALEFTLGFLGNLVVVLGYLLCLPEWKSTNVYLFNLAVSDLIFLCTLPRLSYLYANAMRKTSPVACVTNRYILHVNLYSSILFMAWVSVDRFLLVRHPQRNHFLLTRRASVCISALTWLLVNVQIAPLIYFIVEDMRTSNWTECNDFGSLSGYQSNLIYSLALTVTGYVLPLLALYASSRRIASLLRRQEGMFGTSFQRPLRVVRAAAVMFLVLYTPYHVMRNVRIATRPQEGLSLCTRVYIEGLYIVTRPLAFAHSAINPVFYFLMTDKFQELLLDKLRSLSRWRITRGQRHTG